MACTDLTSQFGRDTVRSREYGRKQGNLTQHSIYDSNSCTGTRNYVLIPTVGTAVLDLPS